MMIRYIFFKSAYIQGIPPQQVLICSNTTTRCSGMLFLHNAYILTVNLKHKKSENVYTKQFSL